MKKTAEFRQKNIEFVFQSYNLVNHLNAVENVALTLIFRGIPKRERPDGPLRILKAVGLSKHLKVQTYQMSGGQQQRVGIARAFVANPDIGFADEPPV